MLATTLTCSRNWGCESYGNPRYYKALVEEWHITRCHWNSPKLLLSNVKRVFLSLPMQTFSLLIRVITRPATPRLPLKTSTSGNGISQHYHFLWHWVLSFQHTVSYVIELKDD
jgi:hypothetical protein